MLLANVETLHYCWMGLFLVGLFLLGQVVALESVALTRKWIAIAVALYIAILIMVLLWSIVDEAQSIISSLGG